MAYRLEQTANGGTDLIIDGWEKGIGDSPYGVSPTSSGYTSGLTDIRCMNIVTAPGEGSVAFSSSSLTQTTITGTINAVDAGTDQITLSAGTWYNSMSIVFTGSVPTGVTAGQVYWVQVISGGVVVKLFNKQDLSGSAVDITSTTTGATFTSLVMLAPVNRAFDSVNNIPYIVDTAGRVWGGNVLTGANSNQFTYLGNTTLTNGNGNGLGTYVGSDNTVWLFVFRNGLIDYTKSQTTVSWVYGWNPADGTGANTSTVLNTALGTNNTHYCMTGIDNVFYYCDGAFIGSYFENDGSVFDPLNTATFTFAKQALILPKYENARCLENLGLTLLVGGKSKYIYAWDGIQTSYANVIYLPENVIARMVTVNTNTFIFAGNRGRIYITNGTNAQLFKKIPDHLSGTVEPYFTWGDATYNRNQLYFSLSATTNSGTANTNYGGVWSIDLASNAMRVTTRMSYGTYAGKATCLIPNLASAGQTNGFGLYIGWDSGASTYGVDGTISNPYTAGESYVISDMLPIGHFLNKYTPQTIEYKLTVPMVSGESIQLLSAQHLNDTFTSIGTWGYANDSTSGNISYAFPFTDQQFQWLLIKAVLTSTTSSPSYVRLKEIRIHMT